MKKYKILFAILISSLLFSCYEDNSKANYMIINPIIIEDAMTNFDIFALDTLEIKPLVYKEGLSDSDLEFKWTIYGPAIVPQVLDSTMSFKKCITFSPHSNSYQLVYQVKDKTTGIYVEKTYDVKINSPFGTGLIVCHSEDGVKSDVSLIRCFNYQSSLKRDTIMSNLFSRVNSRKIDGIATAAISTQYGNFATLTVTAPNVIERVDPRDYKFIDSGMDVFVVKPDVINPVYMVNSPNTGHDVINNNGDVHARSFQQGNRKFTFRFLTANVSPTKITKIFKPFWEDGICFDELGGRFLCVNVSSGRFDFLKTTETDVFAWNDFVGYECIAMVNGYNKYINCIMRHKTTGQLEICAFKADYGASAIRAVRRTPIDIAQCPDIDKALFFDASERASIIYYATKDKIYAINYSSSMFKTSLEYEALPGEEITSILLWSNYRASGGKINYTNPNPEADQKILTVSSQHRMLVISLYDTVKKEGIVRHLAVINPTIGDLEKNRDLHVQFGGFGKISVTQFQEK